MDRQYALSGVAQLRRSEGRWFDPTLLQSACQSIFGLDSVVLDAATRVF